MSFLLTQFKLQSDTDAVDKLIRVKRIWKSLGSWLSNFVIQSYFFLNLTANSFGFS
jgi:hypothetical protein